MAGGVDVFDARSDRRPRDDVLQAARRGPHLRLPAPGKRAGELDQRRPLAPARAVPGTRCGSRHGPVPVHGFQPHGSRRAQGHHAGARARPAAGDRRGLRDHSQLRGGGHPRREVQPESARRPPNRPRGGTRRIEPQHLAPRGGQGRAPADRCRESNRRRGLGTDRLLPRAGGTGGRAVPRADRLSPPRPRRAADRLSRGGAGPRHRRGIEALRVDPREPVPRAEPIPTTPGGTRPLRSGTDTSRR